MRAYLIGTVMLGAVAAPGFRPPSADGYPLSTYPMFAQRRGRVHEVLSVRARAIDADAARVRVPPRYIANAETMQAVQTLSRAVRAGDAQALRLCQTIAGRLSTAREPELRRSVALELVSERVDAIAYWTGHAEPLATRVHARCPVPPRSKEP